MNHSQELEPPQNSVRFRTPAALLRLGQNFDRFYVVVRLKHRQKTMYVAVNQSRTLR